MKTLSVIIISFNEAELIERCLKSIAWANEIIVFDSGSTDTTVDIAKRYTDKVFVTDWPGFGIQKNRALAEAGSDWILSIDADEWVSEDLKNEILDTIRNAQYSAYKIPFESKYCGKVIKHGAWRNDYKTRLFCRNKGKFSDIVVHEDLIVSGSIGRLKTKMFHDSFKDLAEVIDKVNRYSSAGANLKHEQGKQASLTKAILHGLWAFASSYLLKFGFLDGREGFMLAFSNAEGTYYRYLKLIYLNEQGC